MADLRRVNFPILLLSFALSLILWSYVQALSQPDANVTGTYNLLVETRNLPDRNVVVGTLPQTVTFTAMGPSEERSRINPDKLRAYVDLSRPLKDGTFVIRLETLEPYNVTWRPLQIGTNIKVEPEDTKPFNVTITSIGTFKLQDFRYEGANAEPNSVLITGPVSLLAKIKTVAAELDLTGLTDHSSRQLKIEAYGENGLAISGVHISTDTVAVRPILTPRPPRRSLLIQPNWTGTPEFGFTISDYAFNPAQVSIEGSSDAVANLSVIYTKPINIDKLNQSVTYPVELDLPPGVHLTRPETIEIKIFVKSSGPGPERLNNP